MSQYLTYIVGQGDTLFSISQSQLGADYVDEIVSLNNLRYPYISDDPRDQFALPKGSLVLTGPVNSGTQTLTLNNANSLNVTALDTILLEDWTTGVYEGAAVESVSATSTSVTVKLSSPLQNSYTLAASATVFANQQNVITQVLKTGSTIYLPFTISTSFTASQSVSDVFGTDIALDQDGFIQRSNNDLATVAGPENVWQAVAMRWKTPVGGLPGDPTYGNRMWELVGEESEPYWWNLAIAFLTESALSDPRVQSVDNVTLNTTNDEVFPAADITTVNALATNRVKTSIPLTGGGA